MRINRITFVGGLAVGYVLGAQAGRERYEQLKQLARKAAESPAMQQTAGALQAQATATAKSAKDKAADGVRKGAAKVNSKRPASGKSTRSSASSAGSSARSAAGSAAGSATGNGSAPKASGGDGSRPFVPVNGSFGEHDLL